MTELTPKCWRTIGGFILANKKISLEKRQEVLLCFKAGYGYPFTAKITGLSQWTIRHWLYSYRQGNLNWINLEKNTYKNISYEIKEMAVKDYLSGKGGLETISSLYSLPRPEYLLRWVNNYKIFGTVELKRGRQSKNNINKNTEKIMTKKKNNKQKHDKEIIKDQQIRISYLENLIKIKEEEEQDPKKKAHLKRLIEQYKKTFPPEEF